MNKIVNGVANDYEFDFGDIGYSKAYTEKLLSKKDKEIERLNSEIEKLQKDKDRVVSEREDLLSSCLYQDEIIKKANNKLEILQKDLMKILKIGIPIKDITDIQDILRGKDDE